MSFEEMKHVRAEMQNSVEKFGVEVKEVFQKIEQTGQEMSLNKKKKKLEDWARISNICLKGVPGRETDKMDEKY